MFDQIKKVSSKVMHVFQADTRNDARGALTNLERELRNEWRVCLSFVSTASSLDTEQNESVWAVIENLTECHTTIRQLYNSQGPVLPQDVADAIAVQLSSTQRLVRTGLVSGRARNIANRTANLLFAAGQETRSAFGLKGRAEADEPIPSTTGSAVVLPRPPVMELPSAMMYQLRHSLFPAERMIVGAGRRSVNTVTVEALFDVTGIANLAGVKADPNLLAQALIAMSLSGTYFALWIHSHPGSGPGATHPSTIDLRQHEDWLKDYSHDLVSAIMVADRYFRFWGTALESGAIAVSIEGEGVSLVSDNERIYKLEV